MCTLITGVIVYSKAFMKTILTTIASIFICTLLIAQDCDCSVSEVENNTVTPCEYTIGTVVTVYTTTEFNATVQQANSRG